VTTEKEPIVLMASTQTLHVGDPVRVDLVARHPTNTTLQVETEFPPDITLLSRDRTSHEVRDGMAETRLRYVLTSFVIGEHTVFTGRVTAVTTDGLPSFDTALTGMVLRVESQLAASGEDPLTTPWRAYPEPVRDPRGRFPAWLWVLPIVAGVALGVGLWARRFGRPALEPDEPPPPAHKTALAELKQLRESGRMERGEREPFYVELSSIVRRYLEARFQLRATEQTTDEFIRETAESGRLGTAHRQLTADFLVQSDLVKFARLEPALPDMQAAFAAAERLVQETVPDEGGES